MISLTNYDFQGSLVVSSSRLMLDVRVAVGQNPGENHFRMDQTDLICFVLTF